MYLLGQDRVGQQLEYYLIQTVLLLLLVKLHSLWMGLRNKLVLRHHRLLHRRLILLLGLLYGVK